MLKHKLQLYTLTGHFIRYTLLAPGWTPFYPPPPPAWTVETRQDDPCFHVLYTKFWPYIWMQQKSRLIRPGNVFQSSIVQFWWFCVNCILRVLFLSDRSGTRCGLLLLEPICFRVRCVVCSEMYSADLGCNEWLFELLLSFYHL